MQWFRLPEKLDFQSWQKSFNQQWMMPNLKMQLEDAKSIPRHSAFHPIVGSLMKNKSDCIHLNLSRSQMDWAWLSINHPLGNMLHC